MRILNKIKSGVYKITNLINNKCYIGSSAYIKSRWSNHRRTLLKGCHHSKYLQRSWNKYGQDNFKFEVLLYCTNEHLLDYEQYFLDTLNPEYNSCKIAGRTSGIYPSEETRKKLSMASKGRKHTPQAIQNMKVAQSGRKLSEELKKKLSLVHTGLPMLALRKPVLQICPNTLNTIARFESIGLAERSLNISNISCVVRGIRPKAGGFIWKYENVQN
jgi:group I intron endonuclease